MFAVFMKAVGPSRAARQLVLLLTGCVLGLCASAQVGQSGIAEGPFTNGGFEEGLAGWTWMISQGADATCNIDRGVSHGGQNSIRITNKTPKKAHTYGVLRRRITGLKPNTNYRIYAWFKGVNVGDGKIGGGPGWEYVESYPKGSYDWTLVTMDVATRDADNFEFIITCGDVTGELWVDDLQFIERSEAQDVILTPPEVRSHEAYLQERGDTWMTPKSQQMTNDEWLTGDFGVPGPVEAGAEYQFVTKLDDGETVTLATMIMDRAVSVDDIARVGFAINTNIFKEQGEWTLAVQTVEGRTLASASVAYLDLKKQAAELMAKLQPRRDAIARAMQADSAITQDPYVKLWFDIGEYYLRRLEKNQTREPWWARLQAQQIGRIFDQVEAWLDNQEPLNWPERAMAMAPIRSMRFTDKNLMALREGDAEEVSFFATGYGHFDQVDKDIALLAGWGMDALAKGLGPEKGVMTQDRQLSPDSKRLRGRLQAIDVAAENNVYVDFMMGSHGVPAWFEEEHPDAMIHNPGFIDFDIDHPETRQLIRDWIDLIMPEIAKRPNIVSVGLSNEPQYIRSGRTPHSRDYWPAFLEERYITIDKLNATYGTEYTSFAQVPVPPMDSQTHLSVKRSAFDWLEFNSQHFAAWHKWLADLIHQHMPEMPTYVKIVELGWNSGALRSGIDPELICNVSELAGCDARAYTTPDGEFALDWHEQEMWYDLLHSFRGQPIINTEFHVIPNGFQQEIPGKHVRTALWQSALHHVAFSTFWIWDKPIHRHFEASIYLRPMVVAETQRTMLDMRRLAPELSALGDAPKRVALLYSTPSLFWDDILYGETCERIHESLLMRGHTPTFVSETQLNDGDANRFDVIILPHSTHVRQATVEALNDYLDDGGKILAFGALPEFNEYDYPLEVPPSIEELEVLPLPEEDLALGDLLEVELSDSGISVPAMTDLQTQAPAWGIQYRIVLYKGAYLASIVNFNHDSNTVSLTMTGKATNLVNGETVDLANLELTPLEPVLLRIEP